MPKTDTLKALERRGNIHDINPLPSICWERWNKLGMTWKEAVEEASELFHLAVKLDDVRARHAAAQKRRNGK